MQITQPKSPDTPIHPIFDRLWYRRFEAWLGNSSPLGNAPIFPTDSFAWANNLEKNWTLIRQELDQALADVNALPSFQDIMPRQNRISPALMKICLQARPLRYRMLLNRRTLGSNARQPFFFGSALH